MSFNGSGTFNINTAGQPVVTGTVISSSVFNALTADLATGLSTCITKDGQTTVTANIPMNSFKFTGLAAGTAATDSVRLGQIQAGAATLITVTGTNTYAGTMTPALSAYAAGNTFTFLVPNTNTTSCTLNIDGLGAKSITRDGTTALVAGDLVANSEVVVVYDGTQFQVLNSNSKTNFNLSGTLTVAGNTTLSGGTANGVAYLNGSKVLTTGSGFTFASSVLTIDGGTGVSSKVRFGQSGVVNWDIQNTASTGVLDITNGAGSAFKSESVNASVVGLYVAAAGNVGIGTTSPSTVGVSGYTRLVLGAGGSATDGLTIVPSGTGGVQFTDAANVKKGYLQWDSSTGALAFGTAATERMRIDSSGNVGIGTSSPGYKLQVSSGATAATSYFSSTATPSYSATAYNGGNARASFVGGSASGATTGINFSQGGSFEAYFGGVQESGGAAAFVWQGYSGAAYAERMRLDSSGNLGLGVTPSAWDNNFKAFQLGYPNFIAGNNGGNRLDIGVNAYFSTNYNYANTAAATYYSQASGSHAWYQAPSGTAGNAITFTQAMTLDSDGNLLVGTTDNTGANTQGLEVYIGGGGTRLYVGHASGTANGTQYVVFNYAGTNQIGSISQSGTTAVLYNTTSDQRLKENIADADSASDLIDAIKVRQFDWIGDGTHQRYGMIAQELHEVAPEAVYAPEDPDAMMAVDYSKLVPMLIKEIQSLRQRVAQLEVK